jgi:hypothetical protein
MTKSTNTLYIISLLIGEFLLSAVFIVCLLAVTGITFRTPAALTVLALLTLGWISITLAWYVGREIFNLLR